MSRGVGYIEPAPAKPPVWEFRHDDELWFNGKFICQLDFRPDIKAADRLKLFDLLVSLLNTHGKWVGT